VKSAIAAIEVSGAPPERPWPGRSGRQYACAAMGEEAREQRPHRVIEPGSVQEHDERRCRVESAAAGFRCYTGAVARHRVVYCERRSRREVEANWLCCCR